MIAVSADFETKRAEMVERQLCRRGISDQRVLDAIGAIPREQFVAESDRERAYADRALAIGSEQTISQPWIVAAICQGLELDGSETVLEIGTGWGYSAAVLSRLAARVISVERIEELAIEARARLTALEVSNVEVVVGDGSLGLADRGPFEGIAVQATAPAAPQSLLEQLAEGGRMVVPIRAKGIDVLTVYRRTEDGFAHEVIGPCRFVPLLGAEGFPPPA